MTYQNHDDQLEKKGHRALANSVILMQKNLFSYKTVLNCKCVSSTPHIYAAKERRPRPELLSESIHYKI